MMDHNFSTWCQLRVLVDIFPWTQFVNHLSAFHISLHSAGKHQENSRYDPPKRYYEGEGDNNSVPECQRAFDKRSPLGL